jgi:hypothetical protein
MWGRQAVECECIVGRWKDGRVERLLCRVLISHRPVHKAESAGPHSGEQHPKSTYNAFHRLRINSNVREAIRRHAQEMVRLLLRAEVRIVHGDGDDLM